MKKSITPNDLRISVEDYVTTYSKIIGGQNIWRKPLLATARADDRFNILPRIVAEDHSIPQDLLPSAISVIVFFVPFTKELAVENHKGEIPCRNWGLPMNPQTGSLTAFVNISDSILKTRDTKLN